jgi:hypothetical protein
MTEPVLSDERSTVSGHVADPAAVAEQVRHWLGEGQLQAARQLLAGALKAYPADAELLSLQHAIAPGRVERTPGRYPNRQAELDWIARNRSRYQGKWVALVGEQVVAIEDDARVLLDKLKQQSLSETPLVHHLM